MLLIRDLMFCKPGKVPPDGREVQVAMTKLGEKKGMGKHARHDRPQRRALLDRRQRN